MDPSCLEALAALYDHPDADQVLVIDSAHALLGAPVATQLGAMVELAVGVQHALTPAAVPASEPEPEHGTEHDLEPEGALVGRLRATPGQPRIRASDVLHASLTDRDLVLTNRTLLRIRVKTALGAASTPGIAAAQIATDLAPGEARRVDINSIDALVPLAAPTPVMRNWSHSSSEVYEGGERRLLAVDVGVLGDDGDFVAERSYEVPNGLDFAVTASQLKSLIGAEAASAVLPEPAQRPASNGWDVLGAFETALRVSASAMPRPAH